MKILDAALRPLLRVVWRIPLLSLLINRLVIDYLCSRTSNRPRPWSLWSAAPKPANGNGPVNDYASWPSLSDKCYSARHLPPADANWLAGLPTDAAPDMCTQQFGVITQLFARKGPMQPGRSNLLFMFFAQWFTDSVMRIDPQDARRNTSNHEVDLCQIYGLDEATANILRSHEGGRLRSRIVDGEELPDLLGECNAAGNWQVKAHYRNLPYASRLDDLFGAFPPERRKQLYATGLERGNQSVGYVAINTLFLREHNRLCTGLAAAHPDWDDERLFQTARLINIAQTLKILVEDYINHIAGHQLFRLDTGFAERRRWYRPNWISLEFDLLYRWHGMVPESFRIAGSERLASEFRVNNALFESAGLNRVLQDCATQAAGCIGLGNTPAFLQAAEYSSLCMARDFGLRSYNDYREAFSLPRLTSFDALCKDPALRATLQQHYGHIDQLEWLIGLFAESATHDRLFGELLDRMVSYDAFTQILTHPLLSEALFRAEHLSAWGMQEIARTSRLQDLAQRNLRDGAGISLGFASPGH